MLRKGWRARTRCSSRGRDGRQHLGRGRGRLGAPVAQRGHRVRVVAVDEVLLELEPAVRGQQLGPDRRVGHRQQPRRDAQRGGQAGRHLGQALRPRAGAPCATGWCPGRGRPAGTRSARRAARASPALDQVSSRTPQPVCLVGQARRGCTAACPGRARRTARGAPGRRRCWPRWTGRCPARRGRPRVADASARPWLSLAPPYPPARTVTRPAAVIGSATDSVVDRHGPGPDEERDARLPSEPGLDASVAPRPLVQAARAMMSSSAACALVESLCHAPDGDVVDSHPAPAARPAGRAAGCRASDGRPGS